MLPIEYLDDVRINIASAGEYDTRQDYIDAFEPAFMRAVLGVDLYNEVVDAFDDDETPEPYKSLLYGCDFTDGGGRKKHFEGLFYATALYVASNYLFRTAETNTTAGQVKVQTVASEVQPTSTRQSVFNNMCADQVDSLLWIYLPTTILVSDAIENPIKRYNFFGI